MSTCVSFVVSNKIVVFFSSVKTFSQRLILKIFKMSDRFETTLTFNLLKAANSKICSFIQTSFMNLFRETFLFIWILVFAWASVVYTAVVFDTAQN